MSLYVLDTDTLQLYQDGNPKVVSRVRAVAPDERAITIVTVEEQLSGWYTQLRQGKTPEKLAWAYRRLAATVRFLSHIAIVDFDEPAIHRAASAGHCPSLPKRIRPLAPRLATPLLASDKIAALQEARLRVFSSSWIAT